jgi:CspA family cold shock protein
MATGTIKTIRGDRGFGFLVPDGGAARGDDLFFHHTSVVGSTFDELQEGQRVTFEEGVDPRDPRRKRATNVRLLTEES